MYKKTPGNKIFSLYSGPFAKFDILLKHFPQYSSSAGIHGIIQNLPALRRSNVKDGIHCWLKSSSHRSAYICRQLQFDIVHQYEVHVSPSGSLGCIRRRVKRALVLCARHCAGSRLAHEGDQSSKRMCLGFLCSLVIFLAFENESFKEGL